MPSPKPYSGAVDVRIAIQLLNSSGVLDETGRELGLGTELQETSKLLSELVKQANHFLEGSDFAKMVAGYLGIQMNRKGHAKLIVTSTGEMLLCIDNGSVTVQLSRSVPLMKALKKKAKTLGVDISTFGIKRKAIWDYLQKVEAGTTIPSTPKKQKAESKPRIPTMKVANDPPDEDKGPMSAGPDTVTVSAVPTPVVSSALLSLSDKYTPEDLGFAQEFLDIASATHGYSVVKTEEALLDALPKPLKLQKDSESKPSMRQLVQESKDFDLAEFLRADPPKQS